MVGKPLEDHTSSITSVAYSHDGTRIVSSSYDKTIRIWDARTGQMVGKPLEGHTSSVTSVAYLHDGTRIVSGSEDKSIRIWDARTGRMVDGTPDVYSAPTQAMRQIPDPTQPASDTGLAFNPISPNHSSANLHTDWTLDGDGWTLAGHSKLLMWVPPDVRGFLMSPGTLVVMSTSAWLALDFRRANIGEDWRRCYCSEPSRPV
ncbi:WD40 repeat-like protein [Ceratobasidium sp. AG-I]|nr:WD40 repeat-like protein [Ceratobasidium sp. AG-I]